MVKQENLKNIEGYSFSIPQEEGYVSRHFVFPGTIYVALSESPLFYEFSTSPELLESSIEILIKDREDIERDLKKGYLKKLTFPQDFLIDFETPLRAGDWGSLLKYFNMMKNEVVYGN